MDGNVVHWDRGDRWRFLADGSLVECVKSGCDRNGTALCHHNRSPRLLGSQPVEAQYPTIQLIYTCYQFLHQTHQSIDLGMNSRGMLILPFVTIICVAAYR